MQEQPIFKCWSEILWLIKSKAREQQEQSYLMNNAQNTALQKQQQTWQRLVKTAVFWVRVHPCNFCLSVKKHLCSYLPFFFSGKRQQTAVVSPVTQPFSGGTYQHSPFPKNQPDPAHQTWAKSSVHSGLVLFVSCLYWELTPCMTAVFSWWLKCTSRKCVLL